MDGDSEKLIIELNFRNKIIDERLAAPFHGDRLFDLLPTTIADRRTLQVVELFPLFRALDHTRTLVGSARLFHSLMNPSESIELIHAKQDSYCELESNTRLQVAVASYLDTFRQGELALFRLLNAHMHPLIPYRDYGQAMATIRTMLEAARNLPRPETVYLDSLVQSILAFAGSPVSRLAAGPVWRTLAGVQARGEKGLFSPGWRFRPHRLSGGSIWPALPSILSGLAGLTGFLSRPVAESMVILTGGGILLGLIYGTVLKPMVDYESAILPVRKRLYDSNRFASAVEAVAAIDELLSFVAYSRVVPHPTVLPEITNHDRHSFVAYDLRNPIAAKDDPDFVPNDVLLDGSRVTFVTGPNSGGKTTYCKTIVQSQILGQIGAPILASRARLNMTDRIAYQAPSFDCLSDPEGRFGTELTTTRDIFFSITPKSLAVLDEIAEGTTTHEKMSLSASIMDGFHAVGNNTLLVTHSYELVESFQRSGKGQYLQVEFARERPSHRMIPGISRDSHALRVAQKIGFAPADIASHLVEKGFAEPMAGEAVPAG
ncbi:MAG: DNA mismatch repair protein MutS [Thermodesulfobacteriota bacterium]